MWQLPVLFCGEGKGGLASCQQRPPVQSQGAMPSFRPLPARFLGRLDLVNLEGCAQSRICASAQVAPRFLCHKKSSCRPQPHLDARSRPAAACSALKTGTCCSSWTLETHTPAYSDVLRRLSTLLGCNISRDGGRQSLVAHACSWHPKQGPLIAAGSRLHTLHNGLIY